MILVIGDKHYPKVTIEELSLYHVAALQRELVLSNISEAKTFADVRRLFAEISEMEPSEAKNHPELPFLTMVSIWATRVSAGEELSLRDANTVSLSGPSQVRWVEEPGDKAPASPGKARARKGGAAAGARGTGPTPKRP